MIPTVRERNFNLQDNECPDQPKKNGRREVGAKFWMRILAKLSWNLQVSLE